MRRSSRFLTALLTVAATAAGMITGAGVGHAATSTVDITVSHKCSFPLFGTHSITQRITGTVTTPDAPGGSLRADLRSTLTLPADLVSGWRDITKGVTVEGEIDFSMYGINKTAWVERSAVRAVIPRTALPASGSLTLPAASHLFILAVPHIGYTHIYSRDQGSVHLRARRADGSLTSEYFGMQACSRDQSSVRIVDFTVPGSNRDRLPLRGSVAVAGMGSGPTGGRIDTTVPSGGLGQFPGDTTVDSAVLTGTLPDTGASFSATVTLIPFRRTTLTLEPTDRATQLTLSTQVLVRITGFHTGTASNPLASHCFGMNTSTVTAWSGALYRVERGGLLRGSFTLPPFTCVYSRDDAMNRYFAGKVMSLDFTVDPMVAAS